MGNNILEIKNLTTGYILKGSNRKILHTNLNTMVGKGELIAILGPNGAGKSTLLGTLSGFLSSLEGQINIKGKDISRMSRRDIAREIAVVLTDKIDDRYLTAVDVAGTGRYPYGNFMGRLTEEDILLINNSLEVVGVSNLAHRYFYSLSDGEKQKVLLARAIAQDTPLIFLDEPAAFIDSPGKVEVMILLNKMVSEMGKSVIMTTHDTELALNSAHYIWLLGNNDEFITGKPDELVKSGAINRLFDRAGIAFNTTTLRFESTKN